MTCEHNVSPIDKLLYDGKCIRCVREHLENRREAGRRHYQKNKEKLLDKAAQYRRKNPEKVKAIKAAYYEKMKSIAGNDLLKKNGHYKNDEI